MGSFKKTGNGLTSFVILNGVILDGKIETSVHIRIFLLCTLDRGAYKIHIHHQIEMSANCVYENLNSQKKINIRWRFC